MKKNQVNESQKDDTLLFAKETGKKKEKSDPHKKFKLLIVDDEQEIHVMTKLVLADYKYLDHGLEFISTYSGKEAKQILKSQDDIACCLLDVVMETKDAGLEVARFIREEMNNPRIRIVLRTGQPGKAPEKDVILNYDINDYKEKTELTTQKLFTTITTALRSYMHLVELDEKNMEIQSKNILLNEEVARRIVAESNLTKYNRSLERMIESKTQRLNDALTSLKVTEKQLFITQKAAIVSDLSTISLKTLDASNTMIDTNLKKMNLYRQQITFLLEKFNTLETIITLHHGTRQELEQAAKENIDMILAYKKDMDLEMVLERYPRIIEDSLIGIRQISQTINDIRTFVDISDEDWAPTNPNQILNNLSTHHAFEEKKIDIQLDLQDLPEVILPKKNITKVIHAIIDNALIAMHTKGIICVSSRYEDPHILLTISDIGEGISKENLPHVFTPYFSGWEDGGKGLGLSFAKSVFLSFGGDIRIGSTDGEGTMVTLCLPTQTL